MRRPLIFLATTIVASVAVLGPAAAASGYTSDDGTIVPNACYDLVAPGDGTVSVGATPTYFPAPPPVAVDSQTTYTANGGSATLTLDLAGPSCRDAKYNFVFQGTGGHPLGFALSTYPSTGASISSPDGGVTVVVTVNGDGVSKELVVGGTLSAQYTQDANKWAADNHHVPAACVSLSGSTVFTPKKGAPVVEDNAPNAGPAQVCSDDSPGFSYN